MGAACHHTYRKANCVAEPAARSDCNATYGGMTLSSYSPSASVSDSRNRKCNCPRLWLRLKAQRRKSLVRCLANGVRPVENILQGPHNHTFSTSPASQTFLFSKSYIFNFPNFHIFHTSHFPVPGKCRLLPFLGPQQICSLAAYYLLMVELWRELS